MVQSGIFFHLTRAESLFFIIEISDVTAQHSLSTSCLCFESPFPPHSQAVIRHLGSRSILCACALVFVCILPL